MLLCSFSLRTDLLRFFQRFAQACLSGVPTDFLFENDFIFSYFCFKWSIISVITFRIKNFGIRLILK